MYNLGGGEDGVTLYRINKKFRSIMFIAAIVIYIIFAILFGPLWPLSMFGKAGFLGKLVVAGWVALLIAGLNS